MSSERYIVVGLGELLWDLFPSGRQLGGAPANFAYITNLLGDNGIPASRIGEDSLGDQAFAHLSTLGLNSAFLQRDPVYPTGTVTVEVDNAGQPRFEICKPVAWDYLEWTPQWQQLASQADAVCFGSLAQRSHTSRATILSFLHATRTETIRVFDVNLRQHFYSQEVLAESMKLASIVKLNHEELPRIMGLLDLENFGESDAADRLLSLYDLKLVCITRGARGSVLISANECSEHLGFRVQVVDTVGAGDAFTAAMVRGYLRGKPLDEINAFANRVGGWVASQSGATPALKANGWEATLAGIC